MKRPFREHHILEIFNSFDPQIGPLDLFLRNYFRANKAVGAKDRKEIAESIYGIMRWRGLLDHLGSKPSSWESRYQQFLQFSPEAYLKREEIPEHVRVSFPKDFYTLLKEALGQQKAWDFCLACNEPAPTVVRANTLKTTREALCEQWKKDYSISPCKTSPCGIVFHKKINFFALPEFKEGLFEVQDEASQLIAALVDPVPGNHVLDFCAGSGGKALAFAPKMQHKGQLYLHDIRPAALEEAKKRLRRAGIQNAQILSHEAKHKKSLKNNMDWVLVDAPCSGTGTLRRNPDMKWKFEEAMLKRLIQEQRAIFEEALSFIKPKGKIVYATCSILPQENEQQAAFFEEKFGLERIQTFSSFPQKGEMDGFFGVVFKKK